MVKAAEAVGSEESTFVFTKQKLAALPPLPPGKEAVDYNDAHPGSALKLRVLKNSKFFYVAVTGKKIMDGEEKRTFKRERIEFYDPSININLTELRERARALITTKKNEASKVAGITFRQAYEKMKEVHGVREKGQASSEDRVSSGGKPDAESNRDARRLKARGVKRKAKAPGTYTDYEKSLKNMGDLADVDLMNIDHEMLFRLHARLDIDNGYRAADKVIVVARLVYNFAQSFYLAKDKITSIIPHNPGKTLADLGVLANVNRDDTYIEPNEIERFFRFLLLIEAESPELSRRTVAASAARLILFSTFCGFRPSEAAGIRIEHIDKKQRCLTVYDTKNGRDHSIGLSDVAWAIVEREYNKDYELLFKNSEGGMMSESVTRDWIQKAGNAIGKHLCRKNTRNTFLTYSGFAGIENVVAARLANHISHVGQVDSNITMSYKGRWIEDSRKNMQIIADEMLKHAKMTKAEFGVLAKVAANEAPPEPPQASEAS
ncbi:tyrosine-type recombinase/integrase [Pseudomonas aeruginosa]|nr:tyrosine-type recombinase/integrase [Pseudomonas aeruginosa]